MLGRFLELTVRTSDILASLAFYKSLGFRELATGDVWAYGYAVVSDGELCIGLHAEGSERPALTFVHQDLAPAARAMTDRGFDFEYLQLDEDVFNELGFTDTDGHLVCMIEARTFSPPDEAAHSSLCGRWLEITLPVRDTVRAGRFWAPLAPELLRVREEPDTHMRFNAGGMPLGLSENNALGSVSLSYRCEDQESIWIAIAQHGYDHKELPGFEGAFMRLTAPEGTSIYLFEEDFLGELYVVDEAPVEGNP